MIFPAASEENTILCTYLGLSHTRINSMSPNEFDSSISKAMLQGSKINMAVQEKLKGQDLEPNTRSTR